MLLNKQRFETKQYSALHPHNDLSTVFFPYVQQKGTLKLYKSHLKMQIATMWKIKAAKMYQLNLLLGFADLSTQTLLTLHPFINYFLTYKTEEPIVNYVTSEWFSH